MDHKPHGTNISYMRGHLGDFSSHLQLIVANLRRPIVAYLIVFSTIAVSFGGYQQHINKQLKTQDYKTCIRARGLIAEGNVIRARHGEELVPFKENCNKLKP